MNCSTTNWWSYDNFDFHLNWFEANEFAKSWWYIKEEEMNHLKYAVFLSKEIKCQTKSKGMQWSKKKDSKPKYISVTTGNKCLFFSNWVPRPAEIAPSTQGEKYCLTFINYLVLNKRSILFFLSPSLSSIPPTCYYSYWLSKLTSNLFITKPNSLF